MPDRAAANGPLQGADLCSFRIVSSICAALEASIRAVLETLALPSGAMLRNR